METFQVQDRLGHNPGPDVVFRGKPDRPVLCDGVNSAAIEGEETSGDESIGNVLLYFQMGAIEPRAVEPTDGVFSILDFVEGVELGLYRVLLQKNRAARVESS